ncbi:MAG: hypothetical protein FD157_3518 [Rhodocyclaceae bacterium]|nr:MAG: hypothetical protein FD157_3518 [Rhodocyclaceae bacterium]
MYGLPGSLIQFGAKRANCKPGRKSALAQFLEKQNDLFPVDLYTSKLVAASKGGPQRGTSEDRTATPAAIPSIGTEAATRVRTHALGKAIPSLGSTGGVGE